MRKYPPCQRLLLLLLLLSLLLVYMKDLGKVTTACIRWRPLKGEMAGWCVAPRAFQPSHHKRHISRCQSNLWVAEPNRMQKEL
jgi:hypothetical protein